MQKTNRDSISYFTRQHTQETTCTDDAMFLDEFMLEDKLEIGADVEMEDRSMRKPAFSALTPIKKGEITDDCDVVDEYLSPRSNNKSAPTQAASPIDNDSDFASDSSDEENCRFVTRVMRKVPSKVCQRVDTSAIEENARQTSWIRLKDNFR